jgi:hypothetical protein
MIDERRDAVIRGYGEKARFELRARSYVDGHDAVVEPELLQQDPRLLAIRRGPEAAIEHAGVFCLSEGLDEVAEALSHASQLGAKATASAGQQCVQHPCLLSSRDCRRVSPGGVYQAGELPGVRVVCHHGILLSYHSIIAWHSRPIGPANTPNQSRVRAGVYLTRDASRWMASQWLIFLPVLTGTTRHSMMNGVPFFL